MNQLDIKAALAQLFDAGGGHFASVVGGIVEHLNLQKLPRIIELADRLEQALNDVNLIVDRQLDRDLRQLLEAALAARPLSSYS